MRIVVLVCLLTLFLPVTAGAYGVSAYAAPKLDGTMAIDGVFSEPIWSKAAEAGPFVNNRDGERMPLNTTARIVYDDENVYLAIRCQETAMDQIKAAYEPGKGMPDDVYSDDAVEIFFDPMATGKHFYQFVINPRGHGLSGDGTDYEAKLPFEAKGSLGDDQWVLEVRIPFARFARKPRFGDVWGMDIFRSRSDKGDKAGGQYALYPTGMGYRVPGKFGSLIFSSFPGNPKLFEADRSDFGVSKWDPTLTTEMRTPWDDQYAQEIMRTVASAPRWGADEMNYDAVAARSSGIAALLPLISRSTSEFLVYPRRPMVREQILPWTVPSREEIEQVMSVAACRGEYEPATFGVYASEELRGVNLEISDFATGDGKRLPSSIVDPYAIKCWYQGGMPLTTKSDIVLTPELLLKNPNLISVDPATRTNTLNWEGKYPEDAETLQDVDIKAQESQQYWLTFHIPEDAEPGDYTGRVTVKAKGHPDVSIPVKLKVHDFELVPSPMVHSLYYTLRFTGCETEDDYRARMAQMQAEITNQAEHGINMPTTYVNGGKLPWDDDPMAAIEAVVDMHARAGVTDAPFICVTYAIGGQQTEEQLDQMRRGLRTLRAKIEKLGRLPLYVQGKDEASGETLKAERASFAAAHDVGVKVFVATGNDYFPVIGDLLDMPVVAGKLVPELAKKAHSKGYKILSYGNPQSGCENPDLYRRNYGLRLWKAGYDGAMDWEYCGGNWDEVETSNHYREESMAYRGKVKPIDTIQFEGWREGVDDVRYMATLLDLIEQAEKSPFTSRRAKQMRKWTETLDINGDPDEVRSRIVQRILEMRALMSK